jgi:hypothetical protein
MSKGVQTQDQVPNDEVDTVVAGFKEEGAVVTKQRNADGTWKVIATFPNDGSAGNGH